MSIIEIFTQASVTLIKFFYIKRCLILVIKVRKSQDHHILILKFCYYIFRKSEDFEPYMEVNHSVHKLSLMSSSSGQILAAALVLRLVLIRMVVWIGRFNRQSVAKALLGRDELVVGVSSAALL